MNDNELFKKLQYESARVEDMVLAYAKKRNLKGFLDKWNKKPFSDSEHTLYNLVGELLEEISK